MDSSSLHRPIHLNETRHGAGLNTKVEEAADPLKSKDREKFQGDDGHWYTFIRRTAYRARKKVRTIVVKYRSSIKKFTILTGVAASAVEFEEFVASGFSMSKGAILAFGLIGVIL